MLNNCNFIGNLGADPETRAMANGDEVCNLSLAVTEKWKNAQGERKEKTEWVRVVIFSQGLVKVAKSYLSKGSKVYISGKMQTRKWTDQSGNDKYSTEIVLQGFDAKLVMLDGKRDSQPESRQDASATSGGGYGDMDDEIPFAPHLKGTAFLA